MDDNGKLPVLFPDGEDGGARGVLVPCEPHEFGNFISGLLKTHKKVSYESEESFEIDADDIVDIERIVLQRLSDQNRFSHISTTISTYYENGMSSHDNSTDDFFSHSIVDDANCSRILIEMVFLIDFPSDNVPKKQEISIEFSAKERKKVRRETPIELQDLRVLDLVSGISISVRHTHITFGLDMINLLKGRVKRFQVKRRYSRILSSGWFLTI